MGEAGFTDIEPACGLLDDLLTGLQGLRKGAFVKLLTDDLFEVTRRVEHTDRMVLAVQVRVAGEIEVPGLAQSQGCSSTAVPADPDHGGFGESAPNGATRHFPRAAPAMPSHRCAQGARRISPKEVHNVCANQRRAELFGGESVVVESSHRTRSRS